VSGGLASTTIVLVPRPTRITVVAIYAVRMWCGTCLLPFGVPSGRRRALTSLRGVPIVERFLYPIEVLARHQDRGDSGVKAEPQQQQGILNDPDR